MTSNSQGGSDSATPQETQGWRGLHNPEQHAHVDGDEAWCFGCQGPKRDEGACYQFQPCRCCLTAEVESLREENLRLKAALAIERLIRVGLTALVRPLAKAALRRNGLMEAGEPYTRPVTEDAP